MSELTIAGSEAAVGLVGFTGNLVGAQKGELLGHRRSTDRVSVMTALHALLR